MAADPANASVVEELKREVARLRAELKVPDEPPQSAYGNPPAPFGPPRQEGGAQEEEGRRNDDPERGAHHDRTHHAPRLPPRHDHHDGRPRRGRGGDRGRDEPAAVRPRPNGFASRWQRAHDRVWLGPEYWANPLQDWRVAGGRIECVKAAPDRNVHLLTRQLGDRPGDLRMSVRVGRVGGGALVRGPRLVRLPDRRQRAAPRVSQQPHRRQRARRRGHRRRRPVHRRDQVGHGPGRSTWPSRRSSCDSTARPEGTTSG